MPYCNLIEGIYYITTIGLVTNGGFHRYTKWKEASVYEREIGFSD